MSDDRKEQILRRLNFEAFYRGELQDLKPARGDEVLALCPFHDDTNPSLSINLKTGLFNCFACEAKGDVFAFYQRRHGCDFKTALNELGQMAGVEKKTANGPGANGPGASGSGLTVAEFAATKKLPMERLAGWGVTQGTGKGNKPLVIFGYRDVLGHDLADSVRFRFAMADKPKSKTGGKPVLYGLWRLQEFRAGGELIIFEGESDTLTAWLYDLPAVGVPGKTLLKTIQKSHLKGFQTIYVWQEPEAEDFPAGIAKKLPDHKVIALLPPAGLKDISQAHCRGEDVPALLAQLKKSATLVKPPAPPPLELGINLTDLGNAKRLAATHGHELRYCALSKEWHFWNGKYWQIDNCGEVERRAQSVIAQLYGEAKNCPDINERKAIAGFALKSEGVSRILAIVRLAQSQPGIPVMPSEFNTDPWLLNCANGTVDLRSGQAGPHRREDLITRMCPGDYDQTADCPKWEEFIYQIMDHKRRPDTAARMAYYLQLALGYSITGDCREQCLFLAWGIGANGKGTMINTISALLGDYACNADVDTFLSKRGGGEVRQDIARLDGPRFLTCSEVDHGRRLNESLVKGVTGQDPITARFLYGKDFTFYPKFKLWLHTNNKPVIRGKDEGIWRRFKPIRFPMHFAKEQRDRELPDQLLAEGPGILGWLVLGSKAWYEIGLDDPPEVVADLAAYRTSMDELAEWLDMHCIIDPTMWAWTSDLYESYQNYAEEAGLKEKERLKQGAFGRALGERGFISDKGAKGKRKWTGVGLRAAEV